MLKIYVGDFKEDCFTDMGLAFMANKKREWFRDPNVIRFIKEIDCAEVIKDEILMSEAGNYFMVDGLSSGCKAVILMYKTNLHLYASRCGDNCVPFILEIAANKDVTVTLHHCMEFPENGWTALMLDSGRVVTSSEEFVDEYFRLVKEIDN